MRKKLIHLINKEYDETYIFNLGNEAFKLLKYLVDNDIIDPDIYDMRTIDNQNIIEFGDDN